MVTSGTCTLWKHTSSNFSKPKKNRNRNRNRNRSQWTAGIGSPAAGRSIALFALVLSNIPTRDGDAWLPHLPRPNVVQHDVFIIKNNSRPSEAFLPQPRNYSAWPFRYVRRWMSAAEVVGQATSRDAVCELMVLGHPLCDHFLTDPEEHPVRHAEGAMMECIEANGGLEAWDAMLQTQCTSSAFWRGLVARAKAAGGAAGGAAWGRNASGVDAMRAALMDPVMRMHVGPVAARYVPVGERTYSSVGPPLQCNPRNMAESESWLAKVSTDDDLRSAADPNYFRRIGVAQDLVSMLNDSYELPELNGASGSLTPPQRRGPLIIYPLPLGFPSASLVRRPYRVKVFDWFPVTPGYYPFYKQSYFRKYKKRPRYTATALDEYVMMIVQRLSYFAWTHARGGPDCLRHYEILAAGSVPYFPDIGIFPSWVLSHLPKDLLKRVHRLRGVSHIGSVEDILPEADVPFYKQSVEPKKVQNFWQNQRRMLMGRVDRLNVRRGRVEAAFAEDKLTELWDVCFSPIHDEPLSHELLQLAMRLSMNRKGTTLGLGSDAHNLWQNVFLHAFLGSTMGTGEALNGRAPITAKHRCADLVLQGADEAVIHQGPFAGSCAEWAEWFVFQLIEEFHEEGSVPLMQIEPHRKVFPTKPHNTYFFRENKVTVFNFFDSGIINWNAPFVPHEEYDGMAAELHAFTKAHLTTASVASYFLRAAQREDARRVLFFSSVGCDYTKFTLLHGLLELGLNVTSVPLLRNGSASTRLGPFPLPSAETYSSTVVRDFGPEGAVSSPRRGHISTSLYGGSEYTKWRQDLARDPSTSLDNIYGKNFMVGRRIAKHPQISEHRACHMIRRQTESLIRVATADQQRRNADQDDSDDGAFDLIVLTSYNRLAPFDAYPCARELRKLLAATRDSAFGDAIARRRTPSVVYVEGYDDFNAQSASTFFKEGIPVFAREPKCW